MRDSCPVTLVTVGVLTFACSLIRSLAAGTPPDAVRTTLNNGLRVIVVRDRIAPVVTVEDNILAGADETPEGFPGMAHAQEHMLFRGCSGLTGPQTAGIYARLGGLNNADTQQNITQFFATVPADDLDVVLRVDAACMHDVQDSETQWRQERGAIEQEVARDLSNASYKAVTRLNADLFAGTPYAHDALGTKSSFDATTGAMLKRFYRTWYAPNNAVLVVAGDVDPRKTIDAVKRFYGDIPSRTLPARRVVHLGPVKGESFTLPSDLPYQLVLVAYRMPGTDSPDFPAARILSDVLASRRGKLYDLVVRGKAMAAGFRIAEEYRKASMALAFAALPTTADPGPVVAEIKQIVMDTATHGVPDDLVRAARLRIIAADEFAKNSISGLAASWSEAVAAQGRESPEQDVEAIRRVTTRDTDAFAKRWLPNSTCVIAILKPSAQGKVSAAKGFGGSEKVTPEPAAPVTLPGWAEAKLDKLEVPRTTAQPVRMTLHNGIRLTVLTERVSTTVTLLGEIKHEETLETPPGKEGEDSILEGLFDYGTVARGRIEFQKDLDDIGASESAGTSFSLRVLKKNFPRGVQLLAENELALRLPEEAFQIVRKQNEDYVAGRLTSPAYRAERALETALLPKGDPGLRQATPQTIAGITLADVKAYYEKVFRPDLTDMVVIGDVTPQEARAEIERDFGKWTASGAKPAVTLPPVPVNSPAEFHVSDDTSIQDTVILAEELGLNRFDPDYYAIELGNHVLGGGFYATRLYHDLRQVTGYVYTVSDEIEAGKTRAVYAVSYACDPANVSKAAALIRTDLKEMQTRPVSAAELLQAKALLLRQITLSESSEDAIAAGTLRRAILGLPLDEPRRAAGRYLAMTADTVRDAFKREVHPRDLVMVVRGPAAK
jgi:zinc protease